MTDVRIAMKPTSGSSIFFAIGAPSNDPQLRLAQQWAQRIKGSNDDAVSAGTAASFIAIHDALFRIRQRTPQLKLADETATGPARGLPLHTLVILARRLPQAGGGLLLSGHLGAGQTDVVLSSAALDAFNGMPSVTVQQQKRYDLALFAWSVVATLNSVVLCGIGSGDPLDTLAANLANRTQRPVFYYTDPLVFQDTSGTLSQVVVGTGASPATGPSFATGADQPLTAGPAEFLPGAQKRIDPQPRAGSP